MTSLGPASYRIFRSKYTGKPGSCIRKLTHQKHSFLDAILLVYSLTISAISCNLMQCAHNKVLLLLAPPTCCFSTLFLRANKRRQKYEVFFTTISPPRLT